MPPLFSLGVQCFFKMLLFSIRMPFDSICLFGLIRSFQQVRSVVVPVIVMDALVLVLQIPLMIPMGGNAP